MVGNVNVLEQTAYFPSGPVEIVYQKSENDLKLVSQVPITHGKSKPNKQNPKIGILEGLVVPRQI